MSFENKGSMVATIIVAQDGTGNYDCDGVNDQVQIALAIAAIAAARAPSPTSLAPKGPLAS